MGPWGMLLMHLPQVAVAERSYTDLGFLHTKNKGFLRKDVSKKLCRLQHRFSLSLNITEFLENHVRGFEGRS